MTSTLDPCPEARDVWNRTDARTQQFRHETDKWRWWAQRCIRNSGATASRINAESTVLEWGAGGGSFLREIPTKPARYYAVDISTRARRTCSAEGAFVTAIDPTETAAIPSHSVDVAVSFAAFQHFESAEYADRVLAEIARILKPGGAFTIQIRTYSPGDKHDPLTQSIHYEDRFIRSLAYRPDDFRATLASHGMQTVLVINDDDSAYAFFTGSRFDVAVVAQSDNTQGVESSRGE